MQVLLWACSPWLVLEPLWGPLPLLVASLGSGKVCHKQSLTLTRQGLLRMATRGGFRGVQRGFNIAPSGAHDNKQQTKNAFFKKKTYFGGTFNIPQEKHSFDPSQGVQNAFPACFLDVLFFSFLLSKTLCVFSCPSHRFSLHF